MRKTPDLDELAAAVQAGPKYRAINPELVRRVTAQELAKGRSPKEAVKAARSKLHQMGGAYQENQIDYAQLSVRLAALPNDAGDPALRDFCRANLALHASTNERLPVLEEFFQATLAGLGPIHSVLDLACGLNPLCLPWMPLTAGAPYYACDIYSDQVSFLQQFLAHTQHAGEAFLCDLTDSIPQRPVQLTLLLKTIPCLEQFDKSIGQRLLEEIPGDFLLVSFPARSLGGRNKGMIENYEAHFESLIAGKPWSIQRFQFSTELAFLIRR